MKAKNQLKKMSNINKIVIIIPKIHKNMKKEVLFFKIALKRFANKSKIAQMKPYLKCNGKNEIMGFNQKKTIYLSYSMI